MDQHFKWKGCAIKGLQMENKEWENIGHLAEFLAPTAASTTGTVTNN